MVFKIGYNRTSSGSYSSYYKVIVMKDNNYYDYVINAPYTEGQDIKTYLNNQGFKELYISMPYGHLTRTDIKEWQTKFKYVMHETEVVEDLKTKLN